MNWTNEQSNAINLPVSNMIVSAAAGSGKTAVMAERILTRLTGENPVDIDRILVVTYTSAAASEIKERIMKRIMADLEKKQSDVLTNQLIKLPYAHISTIHSFCLDLIRKYFYLLGIDPDIKIADETDVETMKKNIVSDVMTSHYSDKDSVFTNLISSYTKRNDMLISETVIRMYDFSRTMPSPEEWLDNLSDGYSGDVGEASLFLVESARNAGKLALSRYREAIALCGNDTECITLKNFLENEYNNVSAALDSKDYFTMKCMLDSLEFLNWRLAKGPDDIRTLAKEKRDAAKKIITDTILGKLIIYNEEEILNDNQNALVFVDKLVELTKEFSQKYEDLKRRENLIDFSDFEHLALKLLINDDGSPSDVAKAVSENFEEIYIDEFQDCNNIQDTIFKYISGEFYGRPNVFCVGDMKQSIYRFRDSNPLIFRDKCERYPLYNGKKPNESNKILLSSNFRSRKNILDFVNSVFSQIMSKHCGELDYNDEEKLNYGRNFDEFNPDTQYVDIDIIDKSNTFDTACFANSEESLSDIEAEAVHVANKIKTYIKDGYILSGKTEGEKRTIRYSDIVVLLRSTKSTAPVFEKVFNDNNIPVYSDKGTAYFDTEEIVFLVNLLKIIDNPDDDIALASVMKHPVFGFDENDFLEIRLRSKAKTFYDSILLYAQDNKGSLAERITKFLNLLENNYTKSRYMDTVDFICELINEIDFYAYIALCHDRKLKKTNVQYFLRKAKKFEKNNYRGIYSFVRYIENYRDDNKAESAKVISENDNVVRIMSIHKSKGLEFPVVFVSCLGKKFNTMDATKSVVLHKKYGIGIDSIYYSKSVRYNTLNKLAIKRKILNESISEEIRVLYVALTRPTEKLILTGCISRGAQTLSQIEDTAFAEDIRINPYLILSSDCFMKMVLYAAVRSEGFPGNFDRKNRRIIRDGCKYNLTAKNISEIRMSDKCNSDSNLHDLYDGPTSQYENLKNSLLYRYPYQDLKHIPSNMTVTELKKMTAENEGVYNPFEDTVLAVPSSFGKGKKIYGAQLGTLMHYVMEKIDFSKKSDIDSELSRIKDEGVIDKTEFDSIDSEKIKIFFDSEIGKRMSMFAKCLRREFSFKYLVNANEIFDTCYDEQVVIQGTIDAYFEDDDGKLVIVDYKTDKVIDGNVEIIKERYHSQLDHYAKALNSITGKEVKEKILYLFDTGQELIV